MSKITTLDFTKTIKDLLHLSNVYPNNMPDNQEINTGVYLYDSYNDKYSHTNQISFQFLTSGADRNLTEARASELLKALHFNFPLQIADTLLVGNHLLQTQPIYVGTDETNKYLFSFNMIFFIQEA